MNELSMTNEDSVPNFKNLFEAAPGLFLVLLPDSPQFTIVAVSDAYLNATLTKRNELLGRGLFEVFSTDPTTPFNPLANGVEDLRNSLLQALSTRMQSRIATKTQQAWTSINTPVLGHSGQVLNVIYSLESTREMTHPLVEARKMVEAQVKARTQDLLRSNSELEQFAYIASHDLQTPLRHISSYVQLLTSKIRKTNGLDEKTEKWVTYILSGTQQMKDLISDLLSYSRIGRADIDVEEIDIAKLLEHVVDKLQVPIVATNAKLICGDAPKILGIKSQIEQLFQNLIENALKFKKPNTDPVVTINYEDDGEHWKFSVSDNGIGIDPKYSERIFKMFHRLHSADEYKGTGIGLAICKKVVEFHGGRIWLNSKLDEGARFCFILPKHERVTSHYLVKEKRLNS